MALRLFFFLCWCGYAASAQPLPTLIPYSDGTRWGFADTTGRVTIQPQWDAVEFFEDGRARVAFDVPGRTGQYTVCLIDAAGHYIIPPSMGWNGDWRGWGATALNAHDSAGRWGLVDTGGRVLVPFQYAGSGYAFQSSLRDSFKIVFIDGMQGVINRQGDEVIPARRVTIYPYGSLEPLGAVAVIDPDYAGGYNGHGIVTTQGRTVVPPRYHEFHPVTLPGGRTVIRASYAVQNQVPLGSTPVFQYRWFDFETGAEVSAPPTSPDGFQHWPVAGGYTAYGNGPGYASGLKDAAGRILIRCCMVQRVSEDTVFTQEQKVMGEDSLVVTQRFLDTRTLKQIGPPKEVVRYHEQILLGRDVAVCGNSRRHREEPVKMYVEGYGHVNRFYKDSFLFGVVRQAVPGKQIYIVSGELRGSAGRRGYGSGQSWTAVWLISYLRNKTSISRNFRTRMVWPSPMELVGGTAEVVSLCCREQATY